LHIVSIFGLLVKFSQDLCELSFSFLARDFNAELDYFRHVSIIEISFNLANLVCKLFLPSFNMTEFKASLETQHGHVSDLQQIFNHNFFRDRFFIQIESKVI